VLVLAPACANSRTPSQAAPASPEPTVSPIPWTPEALWETPPLTPSSTPAPPSAPVEEAETETPVGQPDLAMAAGPSTPGPQPSPTPAPPPSILRDNQLIVYYGTPLSSQLGILGALSPEDAAASVAAHARTYDELNGDALGAAGALDIIYAMAQAEPTENGLYIRKLPDEEIRRYIALAEQHDLQVMLDLQIGRASILDEVRAIEPFLLNPRVHVAIDPEYAVGPYGVPIETPGQISGDEINAVQDYLRSLVEVHGLPPKVLVIHQYMDATVVDGDRVLPSEDVDLVVNMDAFGDTVEKQRKYEFFAAKSYSRNDGFNVFLEHDHNVMSELDILRLSPVPRVIFYQ
jgi:hypothetical protein